MRTSLSRFVLAVGLSCLPLACADDTSPIAGTSGTGSSSGEPPPTTVTMTTTPPPGDSTAVVDDSTTAEPPPSTSTGGDTCSDGVQNGDETDVDCGGPDCSPCADGGACLVDGDCESGTCDNGTCA